METPPHDAELHDLLRRHPDARLAAFDRHAVRMPMPPSVAALGYEELPTGSMVELVVPQDRGAVVAAWEQMRSTGAAVARTRLLDGRHVIGHLVQLADGNGSCVLALLTESEVDPAAVIPARDAESRWTPRLCRMSKDEVAVVVDIDEAAELTFGWSPEQLVGRRSLELIHPEDQEEGIRSWLEMLAVPNRTRRWKGRHLCRDGTYKWMEVANTNLLEGPEGIVACEMVDIGHEVEAREALIASERLFKGLAEALPLGVAQLRCSGTVVFSNERLAEVAGAELGAIDDLGELISHRDRDRFDRGWRALVQDRVGHDSEFELLDGRWIEVVARPLLSADDSMLTGALICLSDVSERVRARRDLEHRAQVDPLTQVLNRHAIEEHLRSVLEDGRTSGVAVVFIDLDAFKRLNDDHGHTAGDAALIEVGRRLHSIVRGQSDQVGRVGGDEFIVVCSDVHDIVHARELRDRVDAQLNALQALTGDRLPGASVGLAWSGTDDAVDAVDLVRRADEDMYRVKRRRHDQRV